jgi:hypothetical protein
VVVVTEHILPTAGCTEGIVALHGRADTIRVGAGVRPLILSLDSIGFGRLNVAWRLEMPAAPSSSDPLLPDPDAQVALEALLDEFCPPDRARMAAIFAEGIETLSSTRDTLRAANLCGIRPTVDG